MWVALVVAGLSALSALTDVLASDRIGAHCQDGSRSSATGPGACSSHGGVSAWILADRDPETGEQEVGGHQAPPQ